MRRFIKNIAQELIMLALCVAIVIGVYKVIVPISDITENNMIISFVGILATFIVVGNFAQTSRIESDMKDKIDAVDKSLVDYKATIALNDLTLNSRLTKIEENIATHDASITELQTGRQSSNNQLDIEKLAKFLKLFVGEEKDVRKSMQLYARMLNKESVYVVKLFDGSSKHVTISMRGDDKLVFTSHGGEVMDINSKIATISGAQYNEEDIIFAYRLLQQIEHKNTTSSPTDDENMKTEKTAQAGKVDDETTIPKN